MENHTEIVPANLPRDAFTELLVGVGLVATCVDDLPASVALYSKQIRTLIRLYEGNHYKAIRTLLECLAYRPVVLSMSGQFICLWQVGDFRFEIELGQLRGASAQSVQIFQENAMRNGWMSPPSCQFQNSGLRRFTTHPSIREATQNEGWRTMALSTLETVFKAVMIVSPDCGAEMAQCVSSVALSVMIDCGGPEQTHLQNLHSRVSALCTELHRTPGCLLQTPAHSSCP